MFGQELDDIREVLAVGSEVEAKESECGEVPGGSLLDEILKRPPESQMLEARERKLKITCSAQVDMLGRETLELYVHSLKLRQALEHIYELGQGRSGDVDLENAQGLMGIDGEGVRDG